MSKLYPYLIASFFLVVIMAALYAVFSQAIFIPGLSPQARISNSSSSEQFSFNTTNYRELLSVIEGSSPGLQTLALDVIVTRSDSDLQIGFLGNDEQIHSGVSVQRHSNKASMKIYVSSATPESEFENVLNRSFAAGVMLLDHEGTLSVEDAANIVARSMTIESSLADKKILMKR